MKEKRETKEKKKRIISPSLSLYLVSFDFLLFQ